MRVRSRSFRLVGALLLAVAASGAGGAESQAALEQLTSLPGDEGRPVHSPDGKTLVFAVEAEAGGVGLALLNLETRAWRRLVDLPGARVRDPAWVGSERVVFLLSKAGATSVRSIEVAGGAEREVVAADVSPDRLRVAPSGRLAYSTRDAIRTQLWVSVARGEPRRVIDHERPLFLAGWSFDENGLVVTASDVSGQDLYLVGVEDGALRPLTDHLDEEWMAVPAPRGPHVAYYTTYGPDMTDIRVVSLETGAHTRLTRHPAEDFYPAWSPDQRFIAFLSDRQAKSGLWKVEVETGAVLPLLPDVGLRGAPVWSPNGDAITFQRRVVKERLFRLRSTGGTPEAVSPEAYVAADPVVSPDGTRIAFHTTELASEGDVAILHLESGEIDEITDVVDNVKRQSWSKDGSRLAVRWSPGGWFRTCNVHVLDPDSGTSTALTDHGWVDSPVWCGDHVYYRRPVEPRRGGSDALWRVPTSGGAPSVVVDKEGIEIPSDCTPDGELLYTLRKGGESEVRSLSFRGDGQVRSDVRLILDGADARQARDGKIAYRGSRNGATDLFVLDPKTAARVRLTDSRWHESAPDWSPDGRWVYFSVIRGDVDLWRVRLPPQPDASR